MMLLTLTMFQPNIDTSNDVTEIDSARRLFSPWSLTIDMCRDQP